MLHPDYDVKNECGLLNRLLTRTILKVEYGKLILKSEVH